MLNLNLNKRQKIVISAVLLTIGLISTQMVNFDLRFRFLGGLSILTYILSLWSLREGINLTKAFILMILPTLFTLGVASFYFLLPVRWLTRLPVAFLFGLLFYLLLLAQNVFNVASLRTIPLYRAASTANLLFTLLAAFFLYHVIFAFNLLFLWNAIAVFFVSFPLILQVIWSMQMEDRVSGSVIIHSLLLSLVLGEFALSFSFWPQIPTIWALSLSSAMYVLLGLTTQFFKGRLNRRVGWEYIGIGIVMLTVSFFATGWAG